MKKTTWYDASKKTTLNEDNIKQKIKVFAELVEKQQIERLGVFELACKCNIDASKVSIKEGKKYIKVDVGSSGKYMIDSEGNIFGIKAYGVINKKHHYGSLETINEYYWGSYKAQYRAFKVNNIRRN